MKINTESMVEKYFLEKADVGFLPLNIERIPVVMVDNYIALGKLTALRFIEWIYENPEGVVSLPTGKTPEYFIKWFNYFKNNFNKKAIKEILEQAGLSIKEFPSCKGVHFVQIDEFFPMDPQHERSFNYYIKKFYFEDFGIDQKKAMLFNTWNFPQKFNKRVSYINNIGELFNGIKIDFSLRFRQVSSDIELMRQDIIRSFDQFCQDYEEKIRGLGGIGFFLGGIGPDGHIAFNVKNSSHFSCTRLTSMNYETMACASQDLGGIELARKKAVITIGLETITYNPEAVAIIFAAGESKANLIKKTLEEDPNIECPSSALQKLKNARFYLTKGSTSKLLNRFITSLKKKPVVQRKEIEKLIIDGAIENNKSLFMQLLNNKKKAKEIPVEWEFAEKLSDTNAFKLTVEILEVIKEKIRYGLKQVKNECFLHTAPHHDDIELAYFPYIHHLVRSETNTNYFAYLTSGFTSVTNQFVFERLSTLYDLLVKRNISEIIPKNKISDKTYEIYGYLNSIAQQNKELQDYYSSVRLLRNLIIETGKDQNDSIMKYLDNEINSLKKIHPGSFDTKTIQNIKSWIREWEADTVWSHFGLELQNIYHLRLKFYTDEIFPHDPEFQRDVMPILNLIKRVKPTVITLALDPEGNGPDTHYKCLLALRYAIKEYVEKSNNNKNLRLWGYRNIWSRFHISDANIIIPVSLNSFSVLHNMFTGCFVSQKKASYPSYEYDGPFSKLAQKIWVEQFNDLIKLAGTDFFYKDAGPMMRRAFGAIYLKEMTYEEFLAETQNIENLINEKKIL